MEAPHEYRLTRSLFLRLLAAVYLIAFASWWVQVPGLIGPDGILPAADLLQNVRLQFGLRSYMLVPTLGWLFPTAGFLRALAAAGAALSVAAMLGFANGPVFLLLWLFYLSQVNTGGDFMSYQWDALLLEAGFLAIFFAPWKLRLNRAAGPAPTAFIWLFRWLLFREMFSSGMMKLLSGDRSWRSLTALSYHYQTQPLPNALSWYMQQLPAWFQKMSAVVMFGMELGVPFLLFAPWRRVRFVAAGLLVFLQVLIGLTGNYTFFNCLTVVLCLIVIDDTLFQRILPPRLVAWLLPPESEQQIRAARKDWRFRPYKWVPTGVLAFLLLWLSVYPMVRLFGGNFSAGAATADVLAPFFLVNDYGLFAVMTTRRPEIIVEGSRDGVTWLAYEFKYKPGDLKRAPRFVAPHQPRLDWQMWFAALGNYRTQPWFVNFVVRLLQGSPDVVRLLARDPFSGRPPKYIRAVVYDYRFTTRAERRATGNWWIRQEVGEYLRPVSLESFSKTRQ